MVSYPGRSSLNGLRDEKEIYASDLLPVIYKHYSIDKDTRIIKTGT
jgi:hypothetical protein